MADTYGRVKPPSTVRKSPAARKSKKSAPTAKIVDDTKVPFKAFFVKNLPATELRKYVGNYAEKWFDEQRKAGPLSGCVVFDIDDTLINGNQAVANGFEFMKRMYNKLSRHCIIHVVTARPEQDRDYVFDLLEKRGILHLPIDRLHMMKTEEYESDEPGLVEKFKWDTHKKVETMHGRVLAKFGDRLWDVASMESLDGYLSHIKYTDCYIFFDPALKHCLSAKLPGLKKKD